MAADKKAWPVSSRVYMGLVASVLLAAIVELVALMLAFSYCFVQVYRKADTWSVKIMAVLMNVFFTGIRCLFVPVMMVTLPLPPELSNVFGRKTESFLQWFAFYTFAVLLTVPWLICVYQLVYKPIGRSKTIEQVLDAASAPKVVVVMPVYREGAEVLMTAIDSILDSDYPVACLHLFLSFDGDEISEAYKEVLRRLDGNFPSVYPVSGDIAYRNSRVTVSRFPHGGKRHCQKKTFGLINRIYERYMKEKDDLFILFIDSDCILDKVCIQNFMYDMELKPGSNKDIVAMTGVITSTAKQNTFLSILQDVEYIHGQLFERTIESGCGSVTCLPGALTMLRFSAFRRVAKHYFADKAEHYADMFDYSKCHLGEDRWLTHLFMVAAQKAWQIQMCTGAFCKTEAVKTFADLLKQRRRWFLGYITNEACFLTDIRCWRRYPVLCGLRLMHNTIRTTPLLFSIMVLSVLTTSNKIGNLPVGFIAISLGLNYLLMIYFGLRLKRYKTWLYIIMFVANPFFNYLYTVYGVWTAGDRTWGGPRADAAAADETTTVQQIIHRADENGDDLNVPVETFRSAAQAASRRPENPPSPLPLQPPDRLIGRFAAPDWSSEESTTASLDSQVVVPDVLARHPDIPCYPRHRRHSSDSAISNVSGGRLARLQRDLEAGNAAADFLESSTRLLTDHPPAGPSSPENPFDVSPTPSIQPSPTLKGKGVYKPLALDRTPPAFEPAHGNEQDLGLRPSSYSTPGNRPVSLQPHALPRSPLGRASFEYSAANLVSQPQQASSREDVEMHRLSPESQRSASSRTSRRSKLAGFLKPRWPKKLAEMRRGGRQPSNDNASV